MRLIRAVVPAVALVLALSCSDEPTPAGEDAGTVVDDAGVLPPEDAGTVSDAGTGKPDAGPKAYPPVTAAEYCQKYAQAVCAREVRCALLDPSLVPTCEKVQLASCGEGYLASGAADGRLTFDEAAAGQCVGESEDLGCHLTTAPAICSQVTAGKGVADAPCFAYGTGGNAECASGHFCLKVEGQCPFKCVAYRKADESCGTTSEVCDPSLNLLCDTSATPRTCKPKGRDGADCFWDSDCDTGYLCDWDTELCVKEPPKAKLGEQCETTNFYYPECDTGLYCRRGPSDPNTGETPPGICPPQIAEGGSCTGYGQCQTPLYCNAGYSVGVCQKKKTIGERCDNYNGCRNRAYCDDTGTGACQAYPLAGESCDDTFTCGDGARCDFSQVPYTCVALLADYEPCTTGSYCASGRCARPPPPANDADAGFDSDDAGYDGPVCLPQCAP